MISAWLKIVVGLFLVINASQQLLSHSTWWFIQNVNLIFHEAGHVFLVFFGHTLHLLGGTIFEICVPLLITAYFYRTQQYFSASFGAWWLSTALISVSIYASDAEEQILPLLGGSAVKHDWHTLLREWDWLAYADIIGYIFWLASLGVILSIFWFIYQDKHVKILVFKYLKK